MGSARVECLAILSVRLEEEVGRARSILEQATRITVLTGAGVSAESVIPTFRGSGGLWRTHRPEELATPEAFEEAPQLVWEWYQWRRRLIAECSPNAGHQALARLALKRDGVTLITQNVDGLHHRAARTEAKALNIPDPQAAFPLELHGAINRDRCFLCSRLAHTSSHNQSAPPRCTDCGGPVRPDVVWFGESLAPKIIQAAEEAALRAEACLIVGTSALVHPAAGLPAMTLRAGGLLIEVNLEATPLTNQATVSLRGRSASLLTRIVGA